ncbi:hypothetical protein FRC08_012146 [Ceratobasidium sp. 394]|nr:hypothetical protein FRC08_012146 [Ceratobasidium sp. 394]KAG9077250.1 hypothetical protein FS749_010878 [Ceratobasidium sp. UAMH 11750]
MHPIFEIHDLVGRLARELNPIDRVNLLRVSRQFFAAAAPLVWWKVEGVHHLLALLPGANIAFSPIYPRRVMHMNLSNTRSQNLARFRLYAPFVKSLEVYGRNSLHDYDVTDWQVLPQHAEDNTLLPNLLHLTLTSPFPIRDYLQMIWICSFLAPSILDIRVIRTLDLLPPVRIQIARDILTRICEITPKIQRLSLFIGEERIDRPEDADMAHRGELPLSDCFKNLPALQEITSTEAILGADVFRALSGLAQLKALDIWVDGRFVGIWERLDPRSLPSNPFPALERFSMGYTDASRVWAIFERPVFIKLSSLRLGFNRWPRPEEGGAMHRERQLIELIARACPQLTDLYIIFDEERTRDELVNLLELAPDGGTALSSMSKLPLKTVHLSGAVLGYPDDDPIHADALQLAWPLVTELSMPDQQVRFDELYEFSQLPNLELLTVGLVWEQGDDFFEQPIVSSSLRTLRGSAATYLDTAPDVFASILHHCWPNLEEVVFHMGVDDPPLDDSDRDDIMFKINEINRALQRRRAFHGNLA